MRRVPSTEELLLASTVEATMRRISSSERLVAHGAAGGDGGATTAAVLVRRMPSSKPPPAVPSPPPPPPWGPSEASQAKAEPGGLSKAAAGGGSAAPADPEHDTEALRPGRGACERWWRAEWNFKPRGPRWLPAIIRMTWYLQVRTTTCSFLSPPKNRSDHGSKAAKPASNRVFLLVLP